MITYGVVMAGGGGTRLWPLSTSRKPKQFLNLSGRETLVNEAYISPVYTALAPYHTI